MFFLGTYILIDKYYPNLLIQFIVGCVCYIFAFFIIKDMISEDFFEEYKCYIVSLITIDAIFMIYKIKSFKDNQNKIYTLMNPLTKQDNLQNDNLSSEINDYKITHESSGQETDNENHLFSTSEEKPENIKYNLSPPISMNNTSDQRILDSESLSALSIDFDK